MTLWDRARFNKVTWSFTILVLLDENWCVFFLKKKHTFTNDVFHCIWYLCLTHTNLGSMCEKQTRIWCWVVLLLGLYFSFKRKTNNLPSFIWTDNDDVSIINSLYEKVKQDIHCVIRWFSWFEMLNSIWLDLKEN